MTKISIVITAYNEERNIKDCLGSARSLTDEIIVVDNSSSDKTAQIAKKIGAKVFTQKNDPARIDLGKNFGFSKANGIWILSLDADERLTPELAKEIKSVISHRSQGVNGFWIPRKNIIFGKWIKNEMWWPDYQLKIFRRGKGGFDKNGVHKPLKVEGETGKLENPLIHNNYVSVFQYIEKLNNYTETEVESLISQGYKFNWADSIRFPVNDFVKTFFLQKGYRDGLHGLVLSILQGFYMEVVFAKLWERQGFIEEDGRDFLKGLKEEFRLSKNKLRYWFASALINETKNPFKKIILRSFKKIAASKIEDSS